METKSHKAIVVSNCGLLESVLYYNEVFEISDLITKFLSKVIVIKNQCLALNMSHNIYIPSIILSLQKMDFCFIFLPDTSELNSVIKALQIEWVLSFHKTDTVSASLSLKNCNLYVTKTSCKQTKTYQDISYIIRTSGTTSESKFVKVGQYCIKSNVSCLSRIFHIQQNDVIYFGTPLTFDPSIIELLLALENKACLLIASSKCQLNPIKLYQTLFNIENGITILQMVPSIFMRWSDQQIQDILSNKKLRVLALGGESFPQSLLNYKKSNHLKIFNLYGITEVSCWATFYKISEEIIDEIPLGAPLDDTIIEIRDASSDEAILEGEGEIFIGSANRICSLNEEVHDDKAIVFRATGDIASVNKTGIYHRGRTNDTFKRLGHKIHLNNVEKAVEKETGLFSKCVWLKKESKLLLFLIIENFDFSLKEKTLDKLRIKLLHCLPKHNFPDFIDIIHKCPTTSHGKTNRNQLELLYLNRVSVQQNSPKELLNTLICKYFGLSPESVQKLHTSTFFELGGNSILAVQFLNEFKDETKTENSELVKAIFEGNLEDCFKSIKDLKIGAKRGQKHLTETSTVKKIKTEIQLKVAWKYNLEACVDSTPFVFQHNGKTLVAVGSFSHIFVVLDAFNASEIAKYILPDVIEASPCLSDCTNFLYVGSFDGCLFCLEFATNEIKWTYRTSERIKCKPTLSKTRIIFGSYDKYVHCIKALDGSVIWKTLVEESITATPLIEKEKVYIATICGTCLCLFETTGEVIWKFKTCSPIFGSPAIIKDVIAFPNVHGNITFLTLNGEKLQLFETSGHLYSSLVVYNNCLIFGTNTGNFYVLEHNGSEAKIKCVVNLNDGLTTACIFKNRAIIAGNSGSLFIVDFNGRVESELTLANQIFSSAVVSGSYIFVGCRDNNLYCIEILE